MAHGKVEAGQRCSRDHSAPDRRQRHRGRRLAPRRGEDRAVRLREQPARVTARQRLLEVDRRSAAAAAPPLASPPLLQAAPVHAVWRDGVYHEAGGKAEGGRHDGLADAAADVAVIIRGNLLARGEQPRPCSRVDGAVGVLPAGEPPKIGILVANEAGVCAGREGVAAACREVGAREEAETHMRVLVSSVFENEAPG
eukprot:CAMPEP_0185302764 /NCGR_PEP_ID=MMETSP1363-20130426/13635_1 /TAXON_ID=38817 /ORGANISM="Gephyrocapsa oceanica, Strain RCC1303" /LENGTH=196 /DNA_ID=CAMNT_0027899855 /DNA_START=52 /DNA_END=638 /DNA_ORIENTATION=+